MTLNSFARRSLPFVFLTAWAATAFAQAPAVSADDRKFMENAAMGGMAEVEIGKLAQQKASSDAVKQFGSRMVTDHGKANDELKTLASSKNVVLPTALDAKHKADMDKLAASKQFDRDYMDMMVKDHVKDVAEFRKESTAAKDADLRGFVTKTLPTLEDHLKQAQETAKTAGAAKK